MRSIEASCVNKAGGLRFGGSSGLGSRTVGLESVAEGISLTSDVLLGKPTVNVPMWSSTCPTDNLQTEYK